MQIHVPPMIVESSSSQVIRQDICKARSGNRITCTSALSTSQVRTSALYRSQFSHRVCLHFVRFFFSSAQQQTNPHYVLKTKVQYVEISVAKKLASTRKRKKKNGPSCRCERCRDAHQPLSSTERSFCVPIGVPTFSMSVSLIVASACFESATHTMPCSQLCVQYSLFMVHVSLIPTGPLFTSTLLATSSAACASSQTT